MNECPGQPSSLQQIRTGLQTTDLTLVEPSLPNQVCIPPAQSTTVILVKHPVPCFDEDLWTIKLRALSYEPVYLPVLDFSFDRINELAKLLQAGSKGRWAGVVVTSARSAEALQKAIYHLRPQTLPPSSDWSSVPFFAVGPATARALQRLEDPSGSCVPPLGGLSVLGEHEAGSGQMLGSFISRHFGANAPNSSPVLPLLYLTGAHQHPGLSGALSSAQPPIPFVEFQVYTARPVPSPTLQPQPITPPRWAVFFSPNSASIGFPRLKELLDTHLSDSLRFAAIGPSTCDALKSILGRSPDAVAKRPQPDSLLEAIRAVENESHTSASTFSNYSTSSSI
ncbi:hypothetical protein CROQUDRAFT_670558 [Cronartium quercuum f. sp. fusiforme G11]|uniref:Tetrapyrrole biosynthesis uroporphyrinogen III synthase domain-containing protein n=1 Tax=Cronartium quercuum f. sp. fusiforme G11 TaxID=708437 RepID=A0A9P6TD75_9BASI|nr:hypothetical protein CROQUDRAFT_670558 [Cronartium quercuum f. sp. fusiforme G11]